jgi:hypothetical protein
MKSSAAEIEEQRRRNLANHPIIQAELRKLRASDVGTATLVPKVSDGNEALGNEALYDSDKAAA